MKEIRVIRYSNESGSREGVYFTEDFEVLNSEIIPYCCTVNSDLIIEVSDFDLSFPLDYNLER